MQHSQEWLAPPITRHSCFLPVTIPSAAALLVLWARCIENWAPLPTLAGNTGGVTLQSDWSATRAAVGCRRHVLRLAVRQPLGRTLCNSQALTGNSQALIGNSEALSGNSRALSGNSQALSGNSQALSSDSQAQNVLQQRND